MTAERFVSPALVVRSFDKLRINSARTSCVREAGEQNDFPAADPTGILGMRFAYPRMTAERGL
jgi:hypothetical protein